MKLGTIDKLLKYYYSSDNFSKKVKRAMREFMDVPKNSTLIAVDEEVEPFFNEWLIFDFKLPNNKSLVEDFCDKNPLGLPAVEMRIYKDLRENIYSVFEVLKVDTGRGMEVFDLKNEKKYYIHEQTGTLSIKSGYIIFNRVAKINGRYLFVGANPVGYKIKLGPGIKETIKKDKQNLTPKTAYRLWGKGFAGREASDKDTYIDEWGVKKIENELDKKLKKYGLDQFVSVDLIKSWISDIEYEPGEFAGKTVVSMLIGLLRETLEIDEMNSIFPLVIKLANNLPQKAINGKTPQEKKKEPGSKPNLRFDAEPITMERYFKHYKQAMSAMKKRDHKKSLAEFNKCFEILYKDRTTNSEIYRLLANTAIMNFYEGNEYEGARLLDAAIKLNPNYDFGIKTKKQYEEGYFENGILAGRALKAKRLMESDDHPLNRWNPDKMEKWSDKKMLGLLRDFGIKTTKKDFITEAKKFNSIEALHDNYFEPNFLGDKKDEDFPWHASYILWRRWCRHPAIEDFGCLIEGLQELIEKKWLNEKKIKLRLEKIEKLITAASDKDIKAWKKARDEYSSIIILKDCLMFLLDFGFEKKCLPLADKFTRRTGFDLMLMVEIKKKIIAGEDWKNDFSKILDKYKNDPVPYNDLAFIYNSLKDTEKEEKYLKLAIKEVEKRKQNKIYDLGYRTQTIYDDYLLSLQALEEYYAYTNDEAGLSRVSIKIEKIEKRAYELDKRKEDSLSQLEAIQGSMNTICEKEFAKNPANIYYNYLKKFNINFKTREMTSSTITEVAPNGRVKIIETGRGRVDGKKVGRNESCPCNSGKKFKKCCGK